VEVEHAEQHAQPTELDDDVLVLTEFGDAGLPRCERFLFLVRVWADAERSADMVQDDCRLREGARQIRQLHKLRVVQPSLEGQVQRREPSKPGPPGRIGHLPPNRPRLGERRLNWSRGRGMLSSASVGSEIRMSELHDGIALDDDAES